MMAHPHWKLAPTMQLEFLYWPGHQQSQHVRLHPSNQHEPAGAQ